MQNTINELRKERDGGKDSFLLCDEKGRPINPLAFRKRFYNLQKHAGIEPKGLHSLRHTFATRLASGAPGRTTLSVAQIAEILGQNTEFVTQRYLHLRNHVTELTDGFEF